MTDSDARLRRDDVDGPVPPRRPEFRPLPIEPGVAGPQGHRPGPRFLDVVLVAVLAVAVFNYRERLDAMLRDLSPALPGSPSPLEILILCVLGLVALRVRRWRRH